MDLFDLVARLSLDSSEYENGLSDAEKDASSLGSRIAGGLGKIGKGVSVALGAAAAGVTAITKSAVSSYSEYEQLVGGIETLFGSSAQTVIDDASAAFATAGQSMNEYMETSIQSAAALINSLGGDQAKAAELMNVSITDMADNVNKMGTSMEAVQNAYRGFSRGNFTMLDNLALGFAGTKEGMQELLDKAQEFSGIEYDIESYSDIVQAIHVVQEEMGIAGTTSKEASGTISGSVGAISAAWQNLVTGIADPNADLGLLINQLIDSGVTALDNLMPTIEQALVGIADALAELVPVISERLPSLLNGILPSLINAAIDLMNGLIAALPAIMTVLLDQLPTVTQAIVDAVVTLLPMIVDLGLQLILALANGIAQALPTLIPAIVDVALQIVDTLINNIDAFIDAGIALIEGLVDGLMEALPLIISGAIQLIVKVVQHLPEIITKLVEALPDIIFAIVNGLLEALPVLIEGAITLVIELVKHLPEIIAALIEAIPQIILAIIAAFAPFTQALIDMFQLAFDGLAEWWDGVVSWFQEIGQKIIDFFQPVIDWFAGVGETVGGFFQSAVDKITEIWNAFMEIISPLIEAFKYLFETIFTAIQIINERIWNAIKNKISEIWNAIVEFLSPILNAIKNVVTTVWNAIKDTVSDELNAIKTVVTNIWNAIVNFLSPILDRIRNKINEVWTNVKNAISEKLNGIKTSVTDAWNNLKSSVTTVLAPIKDTIANIWQSIVDGAKNFGRDLLENFINGVKEKISKLSDTITGVADMIRKLIGFSEPEEGPLSNFHTFAPDMMDLFVKGITDNKKKLDDAVSNAFDIGGLITDVDPLSVGGSYSINGKGSDVVGEMRSAMQQFMRDLRSILENTGGTDLTIPVYIGQEHIDTIVLNAINSNNYRTGGR